MGRIKRLEPRRVEHQHLPALALRVQGELRPQEDGGQFRRCTELLGWQYVCSWAEALYCRYFHRITLDGL